MLSCMLLVAQVLSIVPDHGALGVSTPVTITGRGFASATSVIFGIQPAASFTIQSDTKITATSPKVFRPRTVTVTVQ